MRLPLDAADLGSSQSMKISDVSIPPSVRNSPEPSCGSVIDVVVLMLFHFQLLSWRISDQQVGIDEQLRCSTPTSVRNVCIWPHGDSHPPMRHSLKRGWLRGAVAAPAASGHVGAARQAAI